MVKGQGGERYDKKFKNENKTNTTFFAKYEKK